MGHQAEAELQELQKALGLMKDFLSSVAALRPKYVRMVPLCISEQAVAASLHACQQL